jgi:hypothetical protein
MINKLPPEIFAKIFQYLEKWDKMACSTVCEYWNRIVMPYPNGIRIKDPNWEDLLEDLDQTPGFGSRITRLTFTVGNCEFWIPALRHLQNVEYLDFGNFKAKERMKRLHENDITFSYLTELKASHSLPLSENCMKFLWKHRPTLMKISSLNVACIRNALQPYPCQVFKITGKFPGPVHLNLTAGGIFDLYKLLERNAIYKNYPLNVTMRIIAVVPI